MAEEQGDVWNTVLTVLGVTVFIDTTIFKLPQMYNILVSGSSQGISLPSIALELVGYSIMLTYQYAMAYPIHTYMENIPMVIQDWLLIFVILVNRQLLRPGLFLYVIIYTIGFVSIALYWLPQWIMLVTIGMTTPILCWSKIDQLVRIIASRDPGQLSSITWFMYSYDTAVRILTHAVITKDIPMFINLASSEIFNVSILISIIYYNNAKTQRQRHRSR